MSFEAAIHFIEKLLQPLKDGTPVTYTQFERDFLEGLCRIGSTGKLLTLTLAQTQTLLGIYTKHLLLPHIVSDDYKPHKG
jgi:hypothetical protein